MNQAWVLTAAFTSLVLTSLTLGFSAYFIWFLKADLTPFFASQDTLEEEMTKIRICVASLVLSIVCSLWISIRRNLASLVYPHPISDLGRGHSGSLVGGCFKPLYGLVLMVVTAFCSIFTTVFAWRWWHALDAQGEADRAYNCYALATYGTVTSSLGVAVPLTLVLLGRAGVTAAT